VVKNRDTISEFYVDMLNLKKLNEIEGKEKYCVEVLNRFAALEDLDVEVEVSSAWETITESINISAKQPRFS
jgi:hypothetical protein